MKRKSLLQTFKFNRIVVEKDRLGSSGRLGASEGKGAKSRIYKRGIQRRYYNFPVEGEAGDWSISKDSQYQSDGAGRWEENLSFQYNASSKLSSRKEALEGLIVVSKDSRATLEALETALDDPEPEIRITAANKLAEISPPLPNTLLKKLIARVWDPEIEVRKAVAKTLAKHPSPHALGPLLGLLGTTDEELREIVHLSILEICEKLGPPPPRTDGDV